MARKKGKSRKRKSDSRKHGKMLKMYRLLT